MKDFICFIHPHPASPVKVEVPHLPPLVGVIEGGGLYGIIRFRLIIAVLPLR